MPTLFSSPAFGTSEKKKRLQYVTETAFLCALNRKTIFRMSKSTARNQQVSSISMGNTPITNSRRYGSPDSKKPFTYICILEIKCIMIYKLTSKNKTIEAPL